MRFGLGGMAVLLAAGMVAGTAAAADGVEVVASIRPVHSLVAGVMRGVGTPYLLVPPGISEHAYSLKPSDASALARARVVFWAGEAIESYLQRPIASLAGKAKVVELLDVAGLNRLPARKGATWDAHDDHGKEGDGDHKDDDHRKGGDDDHGGIDGHVWLDPANAKVWVAAIAEALSGADPANAARYAANARRLAGDLDALDRELAETLAPVKSRAYVVFHDAFQYFERRYGLNAVGSITIDPTRAPGAKRLTELRTKVRAAGAACVFAEPQTDAGLARSIAADTGARLGTLDPIGTSDPDGPDLYFAVMRGLARSLRECLLR